MFFVPNSTYPVYHAMKRVLGSQTQPLRGVCGFPSDYLAFTKSSTLQELKERDIRETADMGQVDISRVCADHIRHIRNLANEEAGRQQGGSHALQEFQHLIIRFDMFQNICTEYSGKRRRVSAEEIGGFLVKKRNSFG